MSAALTIGIQGGRGSFNEEALKLYLAKQPASDREARVRYLYTTDRVLSELLQGELDRGQFAVENTLGGPVGETLAACERYSFDSNFEVVDRYSIKIAHCLMIHPEASLEEIRTIVSHPQVFAQCRENLERRYRGVELVVGEGDQVDPAKVGELIAQGLLPGTTATLSNRLIAEIHGLKIVDVDLQDREDNFTEFVLARRRE